MKPKTQYSINLFIAFLLVVCTITLGFVAKQSDFGVIVASYWIFFGLYWFVCIRKTVRESLNFFLGVAILLRIILLFAFPNLSDDVYRFIWDGLLTIQGINPFEYLPAEVLEMEGLQGLDQALYAELNSQEYYTIYPPVSQGIFAIGVYLFPNDWWGSMFVMKLFLVAFEIGTLFLMLSLLNIFELPGANVLWYALNPLIIVEISGNLHFEGAMVFFLLLAILLCVKNNWLMGAVALAFSVASKLLTLMFFPFWVRRLGWKKSFLFFTLSGAMLLLLFYPLISSVFVAHFGDSLDLYFRKFEFNASFYYFFRWIGFQVVGYNLIGKIGPALALVVLLGITSLALFERKASWLWGIRSMLFSITLYLLLSTTVHPWYLSLPLALALFTSYRFPMVWSGLIMLTYINYSYDPYFENLWIVGLEYGVLFLYIAWEYNFIRKNPFLTSPHHANLSNNTSY